MSTNAIDARAYLIGWLNGVQGMYLSDIDAIPEEQWCATFGGCTRPASEITGDALRLMVWTTEALKGRQHDRYTGELFAKVMSDCETRAGASERIRGEVSTFTVALGSASEEQLIGPIIAPFGLELPLFGLAQVAVSHLWYHDGQLNYIQCLLGDSEVHWRPG